MNRGHGGHEYARNQVADTIVTYRRHRGNFTTAMLSFFLGIAAVLMLANSFLGITLNDIWDAKFTQKIGKMSQSERLIAEGSVIDIARRVKPSIVNINSQQKAVNSLIKQNVDTVGSGIIIRSDGYILTNEHVVTNTRKVTVNINKKEKLDARVVGVDKEHDIAVIKVNRINLPVPKFGSSQSLKVGELAVAIGSPFGLQRSVTAGVVSGVDRAVTVNDELERAHTYSNLIQTDAAINPGNSGGALLNREGEIVGMNSLIYSTNGVSQGVGFAIPIDIAKKIATNIISLRN